MSVKIITPCEYCEPSVALSIIPIDKEDVKNEREWGTPDMRFENSINGITILDLEKVKKLFLVEFKPWFKDSAPALDSIEMEIIFDDWIKDIISRSITDTLSEELRRVNK